MRFFESILKEAHFDDRDMNDPVFEYIQDIKDSISGYAEQYMRRGMTLDDAIMGLSIAHDAVMEKFDKKRNG